MIHLAHTRFSYDEQASLNNINLTISKGECVLICGISGSGKTTLSRIINGLIPEYITGHLTGEARTANLVAGKATLNEYVPIVGSVFQNPKTQHFATVSDDEIALVCENLGIAPDEIIKRIVHLSDLFAVKHLLKRSLFELSGGEKQQIAFLSAILHQPQILVLDEVTSNLDQAAIERLKMLIMQLKEMGMTIVLTEHRLAWSLPFVDRYLFLKNGELDTIWTNQEMLELDDDTLHGYGLRTNHLAKYRQNIQQLREQTPTNEPLLVTKNLTFGYKKALTKPLNLSFGPGQIIGLIGPNGVGKSTFAQTLAGLHPLLSGEILWDNIKQTPKEMLQKSFIVMQDTNYQLFTESVADEIKLGLDEQLPIEALLSQLNLTHLKDKHPMTLSGGEKQRVAIASAIQSGKELLIYDEPTSGLDYYHMQAFGKEIQKLAATGIIQIIITHDEELVSEFCHYVIDLAQ